MAHRDDRTKRGGFTLVEIMIALAILGIVVAIAVSNFQGMMEKYRVEGETKQIFADLMDARGRAMQRNRSFFVRMTANGYTTYEDTTPAPDGNGNLESTDTVAASATIRHAITCDPGVLSGFLFNRNGIASATGTIRLSSTTQPDYDCITVRETRIKMGKWNGTSCDER
jgi:prepilin-type N-terminal cleavage/methylation domain-containing protein